MRDATSQTVYDRHLPFGTVECRDVFAVQFAYFIVMAGLDPAIYAMAPSCQGRPRSRPSMPLIRRESRPGR